MAFQNKNKKQQSDAVKQFAKETKISLEEANEYFLSLNQTKKRKFIIKYSAR